VGDFFSLCNKNLRVKEIAINGEKCAKKKRDSDPALFYLTRHQFALAQKAQEYLKKSKSLKNLKATLWIWN
jgi:hypothetical protein